MKHLELENQFREELNRVSREVEIASAMSHFDIHSVCENLFCGLFKELYSFHGLRNLNKDERENYPGIDLADDNIRVAIQVTSEKSLNKIKDSIKKVITHNLHIKYDRLIIYCLTKKQGTYSQESINRECDGKFNFDVNKDILDYRDLAQKAANVEPLILKRAVDILGSYQRGCDIGLADQDFDPPEHPPERLSTNLVELYLPSKLYIAEVKSEIIQGESGKKVLNQRKSVVDYFLSQDQTLPSDFEIYSGRIITFQNLEDSRNAFLPLIEVGTAEYLNPSDYYENDVNYERTFKSLLRFSLQQKLLKHKVIWQHHEKIFIFLPIDEEENTRKESWIGKKKSQRTVFERKFKNNKPDEVLQTKHLAFSTNFLLLDNYWYISITPDWFFSWGDDYQRSPYGYKPLSGLKKMEKNRSIHNQFRFLESWLKDIDQKELFSHNASTSPHITFGQNLELNGGRYLDERLWEKLQSPTDKENITEELFNNGY